VKHVRLAVVTGASDGLGLARLWEVAEQLARVEYAAVQPESKGG
jgi:NAD(P)-dependent dehydrogenase (short-subunit alcohol dehydrogenase family)